MIRDFSTEELLDELSRRGVTVYQDPIEEAGDRILAFIIELAPDDEKIQQWAIGIKSFGFANLSKDYWNTEIFPKIASVNLQTLAKLVADLQSKIKAVTR